MKPTLILISFFIASCNFLPNKATEQSKGRTFKLTKDSTFIGAWGGELHDPQTGYYPSFSKSYYMMFIYSKNNKLFVTREPKGFDNKYKDEQLALNWYFSLFEYEGKIQAFDSAYILINEKQIIQINEFSNSLNGSKISILENDHLKIFRMSISKTNLKDTFLHEVFDFSPHIFKAIPNPVTN